MTAEIIQFMPRSEAWELGNWQPREQLYLTRVRIDEEDVDVHFMAHNVKWMNRIDYGLSTVL